MITKELNSVYFIGIGGIGMSALARYFAKNGAQVSGYDRTQTALTKQLEDEGIAIHYKENEGLIPEDPDLVVYTPAIPHDSTELNFCINNKYPLKKRAEVLGALTQQANTIAIAGTHGKTSVSALTTHLLKQAKKPITAFVGGIMANYATNLVVSKKEQYMLVEADEFDKSFHQLKPKIAVITSTDSDHLDVYQNADNVLNAFKEFAGKLDESGVLIVKKGLDITRKPGQKVFTYGFEKTADYHCTNYKVNNGLFEFDINFGANSIKGIKLPVAGKHNIENALAAIAVADQVGINRENIVSGLQSFKGVKRRFEILFSSEACTYIDDYAHHPTELDAAINAARELFPGKKISGIFQPHLYSRTRDFMPQFAESLSKLDEVFLLDIYPAREQPIPGVTSKALLDSITLQAKKWVSKSSLYTKIEKGDFQVLLTLGAGDIDQLVQPIQSLLTRKYAHA